jgi:hypothetical protein
MYITTTVLQLLLVAIFEDHLSREWNGKMRSARRRHHFSIYSPRRARWWMKDGRGEFFGAVRGHPATLITRWTRSDMTVKHFNSKGEN